jgi:hypothetical protein
LLPKIGSNCDKKFSETPHFLSTDFLDLWCRSRFTLRNGNFSKLSRKQKRAATRERERRIERRGDVKRKRRKQERKKKEKDAKIDQKCGKGKRKRNKMGETLGGVRKKAIGK